MFYEKISASCSTYTLKVDLEGRDFRERQLDCVSFRQFIETLERIFKLEKPMLDYYKVFYKLECKNKI